MANSLINLVITAVINNYTFKSGSQGTLVVFDQKYPEGHGRAGQPIMLSKVGATDYVPQTQRGWTFDPTTDRINAPVITMEILEERKFKMAEKYGVTLSV